MDRFSRNFLLILIALGIALRIRHYASCPSYWYDEAYLLLNVFHKSFTELLGPLRDNQAAPPLFLWLLCGMFQFGGRGECCMRLPALAASVAGLIVLVPLARRFSGRRGAVWAVAFCATSHHAAAHSNEVKPYALDFLMTELIVLAALRCQAMVRSWRPCAALCLLAVVVPWLSYPSVFVLGGASLALLVQALRRRETASAKAQVTLACIAAGLTMLSSVILWRLVARHQDTSALRIYWQSSFLDLTSPSAAVAWVAHWLIEIGNYGTSEMGLPLVVLALIGAGSLRRRPARLVLLLAPLLLALAASALRFYPLGGRLLFFLVPCLWLLAARGIGVLTQLLSVRTVWLGWLLPGALLAPALLRSGQEFLVVTPRCQFREAFAYVEAQRQQGDVLWVSHPQVYEVYRNRAPDLSAYSSPQRVERAAREGRLWMVCAVAGSHERYTAAETIGRIKATATVLDHCRFRGVEVVLYGPPLASAKAPLACAAGW